MNPGLFDCADKHIPAGIKSPDSGSPETGERASGDGLGLDARLVFAFNEDPLAQRPWYRRRQTRRFQGTLAGARELVALGYG